MILEQDASVTITLEPGVAQTFHGVTVYGSQTTQDGKPRVCVTVNIWMDADELPFSMLHPKRKYEGT